MKTFSAISYETVSQLSGNIPGYYKYLTSPITIDCFNADSAIQIEKLLSDLANDSPFN